MLKEGRYININRAEMSYQNYMGTHSGQSLQDFNAFDLFGQLGSISRDFECLKDESEPSGDLNKNIQEEGTGHGLFTFKESISLSSLQQPELEEPTDLQKKESQSPTKKPANRRNLIDFSTDKIWGRNKKMRGDPTETKHLCKHLYSETKNYLKILSDIKRLPAQDQAAFKAFVCKKICLQSFNQLFQSPYLRQKCKQFFESSLFVRNIMATPMLMKSKLILIKYVQKMRKITCQRVVRWKD